MSHELGALLREALMCSVVISPLNPGLDHNEMFEVARRAGYFDGEIGDTIRQISMEPGGGHRRVPGHHDFIFELVEETDPPLWDERAADFVLTAMNERIRRDGIRQARLDRSTLVERAVASGYERNAIEAAITFLVFLRHLVVKDGALATDLATGLLTLLSQQHRGPSRARPARAKTYPIVQDVIARRAGDRPNQAEPLDAFPDALSGLGFRAFRVWWTQTVREMKTCDPNTAPTARIVLAAALAESALTFVVKHAKSKGLAVFQSPDFQRGPEHWKIVDLIRSAATGGKDAVLTQDARLRADTLARTRQRIHAGRMMVDHPAGPPDIKPEEARDATATAEMVTRQVLEWLARNPPTA